MKEYNYPGFECIVKYPDEKKCKFSHFGINIFVKDLSQPHKDIFNAMHSVNHSLFIHESEPAHEAFRLMDTNGFFNVLVIDDKEMDPGLDWLRKALNDMLMEQFPNLEIIGIHFSPKI